MNEVKLMSPYVVYFGDVQEIAYAKTGLGLIHWRREDCIAQAGLPNCRVESGLPNLTIDQAFEAGAKSLVIGVAPAGGVMPRQWIDDILLAARLGLDIVSGMHTRLNSIPELAAAADRSGACLIDVRQSPENLVVGNGEKRSGRRVLTVGTDCAVGKKYTALAIEREMRARNWKADYRATGQTGIMIAGSGIPIDAVVSDFVSGAAETISPAADDDHWDIIEGQGALSHPSYAGVSLGLLHGSQPDALVLCHDASRTCIQSLKAELFPLPSFKDAMDLALAHARCVNKNARFVGLSVNTSRIDPNERVDLLNRYREETKLPVADPIIDGVSDIVDRIHEEFGE
ncbi:MAG: DUF1611 domain-containing protein [Parvibaculaceae bacterium]